MLIEVESLKELERGKTYALQTKKELVEIVVKSVAAITRHYGIFFIVFDEETHPVDAPKAMEVT